jgi:hypothetical protein
MTIPEESPRDTATQTSSQVKTGEPDKGSIVAARNSLITTLVAICLIPVTAAAGYFMNHVLQAPRLRVEYVNDTYTIANHAINASALSAVVADQSLAANIRGSLMQSKTESDEACVEWLDDQEWSDSCAPRVEQVAQGLLNAFKAESTALHANIASLESWKPPAPLTLLPTQLSPPQAVMIQARQDKRGTIDMLRGPAAQLDRQIKLIQDFVTAVKATEGNDTPRTGDLKLTFGVSNSGDADGLVSNRATARFEGREIWLYSDPSTWTAVKAHSFQEITLIAGGDDDNGKSIDAWTTAIKARRKLSVELTLNSNRSPAGPTHSFTLSDS